MLSVRKDNEREFLYIESLKGVIIANAKITFKSNRLKKKVVISKQG